jgi:hypothetical protein
MRGLDLLGQPVQSADRAESDGGVVGADDQRDLSSFRASSTASPEPAAARRRLAAARC